MIRLIVSAAALSCVFAAPAQAQQPPVEAYGRLPAISDAAISPDGRRVALATNDGATPLVRVFDLERHEAIYNGAVAEGMRLNSVAWADDQRVTYRLRRTFRPSEVLAENAHFVGMPERVDFFRSGVTNLETRQSTLLTTIRRTDWFFLDQGARLIVPIEGDQGFARMVGREPSLDGHDRITFRVDLDSGRAIGAHPNGAGPDTADYLLDERGAVAARVDVRDHDNHWSVWAYDGDAPRLLLEGENDTGEPIHLVGMLADGRIAAIDWDAESQLLALYAINRTSGAKELIFKREQADISPITDPWTRRVIGAAWDEVEQRQQFFDADLQSAYELVAAQFQGGYAALINWSRDRAHIVVYGERGLDGGAYYLYDVTARSFTRLGQLYPELAAAPSGRRMPLIYRARDGVRIPAYLTLPPGVESAHNLPLVVLVHGGPAGRDSLGFHWWASFLASRGYAVLQPNFRGSSGYGRAWERAGWRQWGGLMQTDVEDGVLMLGRAGMIDPARTCIVGASYGGYAALAGAALTPDRYRCAASIAGVSDLPEFVRQETVQSGRQSSAADYWRLSIGDRAEDRDALRGVSPALLADRVQIPILLMHGSEDTVVPVDQSERMVRALTDAGKNVRFVELSGDDHYLSDAATRTQMLRELEAFLAQHLGQSSSP